MTRLAIFVAIACSACVLDPSRHKRPSRMQIGANARHFTAPMDRQVAFRTSNPPPKEMTTSHQAASISGQFTQGMRHGLYLGGELEAGMLDVAGSSTGGAYGIFGLEHGFAAGSIASASPLASIGVELATGWRSVRYTTDADDLSTLVVEPRVRASVWLGEQTSLAVTGGMTLDDRPAFVAGVSIGIHQNAFDRWKR